VPLLCDGMTSGSAGPGQGRPPAASTSLAFIMSPPPGPEIPARQRPSGTGTVGRDGHCERHGRAGPAPRQVIAFIREHQDHRVDGGLRWGVEPICAVLRDHGVPIARLAA
jgi:hypothetical protein